MAKLLTDGLRKGWKRLTDERRALLQLLGRCAISEDQALRIVRHHGAGGDKHRGEATPSCCATPTSSSSAIGAPPNAIAFGVVDRGLFPDEAVREQFPVPEPSRIEDPADERRVRALVVDLLDRAAAEGHILLPRSWVIQRAREHAL